jgi:hypothetical protein
MGNHTGLEDPRFQVVKGTAKALSVGIVAVFPDGRIPEPAEVLQKKAFIRRPEGKNTIYVYYPGIVIDDIGDGQMIAFQRCVKNADRLRISLRRTMFAPYLEAARATEGRRVIKFTNPPKSSFTYVNLDLHHMREQFLPVSFRVDDQDGHSRYFTLSFRETEKKTPIVSVQRVSVSQVPGQIRRRT